MYVSGVNNELPILVGPDVPLTFELGEAFQFDWSCEYAVIGGLRRRLEVAHVKLAASRVFHLVGRAKERVVNARFQAMCSHYLFEPEFCTRAAGWEKGIVEKNVQDRRRQLWQAAVRLHWSSLAVLNDWLATECKAARLDMRHPEWPSLSLADVLEHEQGQLMPLPRAFDGYVEHSVRISSTALMFYQRNHCRFI